MRRLLTAITLIILVGCILTPTPQTATMSKWSEKEWAPYKDVIALTAQLEEFQQETKFKPSGSGDCLAAANTLTKKVKSTGFTIARAPEKDMRQIFVPTATDKSRLWGVTVKSEKFVVVASELTPCGYLEVMSHEFAHMLMPTGMQQEVEDVVAGLAAFGYLREVDPGRDHRMLTAQYLFIHLDTLKFLSQDKLSETVTDLVEKMRSIQPE